MKPSRRLQFSLASLIPVMTSVAMVAGVVTHRQWATAAAIRRVKALGGSVTYASRIQEGSGTFAIRAAARPKHWVFSWFDDESWEVAAVVYFDPSRPPLHDDDLAFLRDMPELRRLDLDASNITDTGAKHLAGLKNLQFLNLENCRITDEGLKYLAGADSLVELRLRNATISGKGLRNLRLREKVNLKILDLAGTRVGDAGLDNLPEPSQLFLLDLSFSQITDHAVPTLARLPKGACVYVTDTFVTQNGYNELLRRNPHLNTN